jgi:hypothetical protein
MRCGLGGLVVLAVLTAPAHGQVKLEWKFKKGDQFTQETVTSLKQTIKGLGTERKEDLETTTISAFTVVEQNADGSVVLEQKITTMKTKDAASGRPADLTKHLEGATFRITLTPKDGRLQVTRLEGYEEMMKKITEGDPQGAKVIRSLLPEEVLRKSLEESFTFLPEKPVNKGEKWERKHDVPLGPLGRLAVTHTYIYEGPEQLDGRPVEKLAVTMAVSYTPPGKADSAGLQFQITGGSFEAKNATGTLYFDNANGKLVRADMRMNLDGKLNVTTPKGNEVIQVSQTQEVRLRVSSK